MLSVTPLMTLALAILAAAASASEECTYDAECPRFTWCRYTDENNSACQKNSKYLSDCESEECPGGFECTYREFADGWAMSCVPTELSADVGTFYPCESDRDCGWDPAEDEWTPCDVGAKLCDFSNPEKKRLQAERRRNQ